MEGPPGSEPKQPVIEERDLEEPLPPSELLDNDLVFLKPPEIEEKDLLSPEERQTQVVEAMKSGNFEVVREWYMDEEKIADEDPTSQGRMNLTIKLATLQFRAGAIDEDTGESYGIGTLEAACESLYQQGNDTAVDNLRSLIALARLNEKFNKKQDS